MLKESKRYFSYRNLKYTIPFPFDLNSEEIITETMRKIRYLNESSNMEDIRLSATKKISSLTMENIILLTTKKGITVFDDNELALLNNDGGEIQVMSLAKAWLLSIEEIMLLNIEGVRLFSKKEIGSFEMSIPNGTSIISLFGLQCLRNL
jgi:hypothetical protein